MKLFVGIDLPEPHRSELARLCDSSRYALPFTKAEKLHVTLRFLGDNTTTFEARRIAQRLEGVQDVQPFPLFIRGLATFGEDTALRVLFAGVVSSGIVLLKRAVDLSLGFRDGTKHYKPHVTLAKPSCFAEQREAIKMFSNYATALSMPPFHVDRFFLFSNPGDGKPYDKIGEFPLCQSST